MASGPVRENPFFGGETRRLEALADGVFAIVMTLLVFEITPPRDRPGGDLGAVLVGLWPSFLAFAISVGLVGIYWSAHDTMFRLVLRTSHTLNWLNLLFLAAVSLVPFSTRLIALYRAEPLALAIYGVNLASIGLSLLALWLHATSGRRLVDPAMTTATVRYAVSRCLVGSCGYALSAALAFVSPTLAMALFASVPWLYILPPIQRGWLLLFGIDPRRQLAPPPAPPAARASMDIPPGPG